MNGDDFWSNEAPASNDQPSGCVGDLSMAEVALDQLRQALYERVEHIDQIPAWLSQLSATDWVWWIGDAGARIVVCSGCHQYVRVAETTNLYELVWLGDEPYCHACAELLRAEHTFVCQVCGHDFYAERAPVPFDVCPECVSPSVMFALSSLSTQLQRTTRLNLPSTLTPREWLDTLDYFAWRCAYCQRSDFACLDHFVPVVRGGGTTHANCVPACVSCNSAKGGKHPNGYLIKPDAFMRVAQFLSQFD